MGNAGQQMMSTCVKPPPDSLTDLRSKSSISQEHGFAETQVMHDDPVLAPAVQLTFPMGSRPAESPAAWRSPRSAATPRGGGAAADSADHYDGAYVDGKRHGFGVLCMGTATYKGDFQNDLQHGEGTLTWTDGRQYVGQFKDGRFHGSGVMKWPDGRTYAGNYMEDRKHGEGTFSWRDGRRYQGEWVSGKRHGRGCYTNAKGVASTGVWEMDRPQHWDSSADVSARDPQHAPLKVSSQRGRDLWDL